MTHINRTTENRIANITKDFLTNAEGNMYFIYGYMLNGKEQSELEILLEECEHVIESMDSDTYYGFDDEYIIIDWYGEDI